MFDSLDVFRTAQAMARHAGMRHAVVAGNMANADTPGYRPADITPFKELVVGGGASPDAQPMRATRPGHLTDQPRALPTPEPRRDASGDPNGNGVSLEHEMLKAVEAKRQHDRALAMYRSSMEIMRLSLGRR